MTGFTPEELAEMAAADAEIEAEFRLTQSEIEEARSRDRSAVLDSMEPQQRMAAARRKAYYEANREKLAAQKKAYREANREAYNKYHREYAKNKKGRV